MTFQVEADCPSKRRLVTVARVHFSNLSEEYLHFVVDKAIATERNFVSDIEKIATLSKDNAREHGREWPLLCDIKAAMADVLPTPPAPAMLPIERRKSPIALAPRKRCKTDADALPRPRGGLETLGHNRLGRPFEMPA